MNLADRLAPELLARVEACARERVDELLAHPRLGRVALVDALASAYVLGACDTADAGARMRAREQHAVDAPGPPAWFSPR